MRETCVLGLPPLRCIKGERRMEVCMERLTMRPKQRYGGRGSFNDVYGSVEICEDPRDIDLMTRQHRRGGFRVSSRTLQARGRRYLFI